MISKIFENFQKFQNFRKISKIFRRPTLGRPNFFSNQQIFDFFTDRRGISLRIRWYHPKVMILERKKVILHSLEFGPLTQETILNIAQFREITLKLFWL